MSTGTRSSRGFGANKISNDRTLRVGEDTEVIAFLEEENFGFSGRHWVDITDSDTGKVRKTVENCIGLFDEDDERYDDRGCPVCATGDNPKPTYYFNVVKLDSPMKPLVWEATTDPAGKVEKRYHARAKNGQHLNDPDIYWAISKEQTGANGKGAWSYSVDPVKERDMPDDWPSLKPLSPERREALMSKLYDETYIKYKTFDELEAFALTMV